MAKHSSFKYFLVESSMKWCSEDEPVGQLLPNSVLFTDGLQIIPFTNKIGGDRAKGKINSLKIGWFCFPKDIY